MCISHIGINVGRQHVPVLFREITAMAGAVIEVTTRDSNRSAAYGLLICCAYLLRVPVVIRFVERAGL